MNTARSNHQATLLTNGKVLVSGGNSILNTVVSTAELYDPGSGVWTLTGAMKTARSAHRATLLANGKVLVSGGIGVGDSILNTAELYDPGSGVWTSTGEMKTARTYHTATLLPLPEGKVLVSGGENTVGVNTAELYDPAAGVWTETGPMSSARLSHTATLFPLPNGKVLVSGGRGAGYLILNTAELYDPGSGVWTPTGEMKSARFVNTATLFPLPNGQVLISGGTANSSANPVLNTAELYNPTAGEWAVTGPMSSGRISHNATLLLDGHVLVSDGSSGYPNYMALNTAELYDPVTGQWRSTASMINARQNTKATLLDNGQVLVSGGLGGAAHLNTSELYIP
jgi:WD40 repeat protein